MSGDREEVLISQNAPLRPRRGNPVGRGLNGGRQPLRREEQRKPDEYDAALGDQGPGGECRST